MTTMGPPRQPAPTPTSPAGTAHSLQLLTEYTHSLDSLPLDLSRNFADLRELDAVLSSSMTSLTSKVTQLTHMIETKTASNEDRLWLLADIAEEASRLKPGADDKIRVACHAADGLRSQKTHMTKLLEHMPDQDFGRTAGMLARKTVYPHVSDRTFAAAGVSGEGGRGGRRRTLLANTTVDATPNKRKRVVADDGDPNMKSPRKERTGDVPRPRNGGARKKAERAPSPTESVLSVASHLQPPQPTTSRQNVTRTVSSNSTAKRARGQAAANLEDSSSRAETLHPPSSSHPSLPPPFSANTQHDASGTRNGANQWPSGQLEGPGMPVVRPFPTPTAVSVAEVDTDGAAATGDGEADGDDTAYCYCQKSSYGEMIACDGKDCEREWFHLGCVGLAIIPSGAWYCDECRANKKTATKRAGRGGKRRAGGARARNTST